MRLQHNINAKSHNTPRHEGCFLTSCIEGVAAKLAAGLATKLVFPRMSFKGKQDGGWFEGMKQIFRLLFVLFKHNQSLALLFYYFKEPVYLFQEQKSKLYL